MPSGLGLRIVFVVQGFRIWSFFFFWGGEGGGEDSELGARGDVAQRPLHSYVYIYIHTHIRQIYIYIYLFIYLFI